MTEKKIPIFLNRYFINAFLFCSSPHSVHSKVPIIERDIPMKNLFGSHHCCLGSAAIFLAQLTRLWLFREHWLILNHILSQLVSLSSRNINTFRIFIFLVAKLTEPHYRLSGN